MASAAASASRSTYLGGDITRNSARLGAERAHPRLYPKGPANGFVKPLREGCHYRCWEGCGGVLPRHHSLWLVVECLGRTPPHPLLVQCVELAGFGINRGEGAGFQLLLHRDVDLLQL